MSEVAAEVDLLSACKKLNDERIYTWPAVRASTVHNVLNTPKTEVDSADAADKHESAERIGLVQGPQKVLQKLKWTEFIFVSVS